MEKRGTMTEDHRFPIVGIGASAGGLKALEGLLPGVPTDIGMAFVIVTHLPPGRESILPEILGRATAMPVMAAADQVVVVPNNVYVSPPDRVVKIADGKLHLSVSKPELHRFPIDQFMISLAEYAGEAAVGILLSGGGTDGTLGVRAIKEHGGLTLAQGHNGGSGPMQSGMPDTAIATGAIDLVLPVEAMGPRLAELGHGLNSEPADHDAPVHEGDSTAKALHEISAILFKQLGHDFSGYKPKTFLRRVRRRMQVRGSATLDEYVAALRKDTDEVTQLFRDLLIGVTSFFRDPAAFAALEEQVIPRVLEGKGPRDGVRVWVPGCATGEEAYSIAILLREGMDKLRGAPKVQVFATDIDEAALLAARVGRYRSSSLANVSPERLQRFFIPDETSHEVTKEIREMCAFSAHNVLHDPPFSRLDLISCRNLLIYFGPEFQARVLPIFHFALKPGGFLFLGTSENVSQHAELFGTLDKKYRIFQRRDQIVTPLALPQFTRAQLPGGVVTRHEAAATLTNLRNSVEARVLDRFAPAHVVVNREGDALYFSAHTGRYLEPAPGLPSQQLTAMARKGLRIELRAALREALETHKRVERDRLLFEVDGRGQAVNLTVEPFGDNERDPLFLVVFQDLPEVSAPAARAGQDKNDKAIERLELDLRETRERLQLTVEEYETAVEELKSSNEELQSINEELQSTNEEMETSKEELQSVNEELNTVNSELSAKVDELDRAHADLRNVFESTGVAIVFLDRKLAVRSFTPAATKIFKLISSDRGRPLSDIVTNLKETGDLHRDIHSVFERGEPLEHTVRHVDGKTHYLMRILPYRSEKGGIDGVLVVLVDVTRLVDAEAQQRALLQELNNRVKRILDVFAGLIGQEPPKGATVAQLSQALVGRLKSMAMCYGLLERANWEEVALGDIVAGELEPYRNKTGERVFVDGPAITLKPPGVLALGMAIHELAVGAMKKGLLAGGRGSLSITWDIVQDGRRSLQIDWKETGGTRAKKPKQSTLDAEFADRELKAVLRATLTIEESETGLNARISIPLNGVREIAPPK
jgi:two-component system CheB/CheR fusion protein